MILGLSVLFLSGCVATTRAPVPSPPAGAPWVRTGDTNQPYRSLGPVQATRKGVLLFGTLNPAGATIQDCLQQDVIPQLRRLGADGLINMHAEQTQYLPITRLLGAVCFIVPLPVEVTIRGEAIQLTGGDR
jgi:hypothetical protein